MNVAQMACLPRDCEKAGKIDPGSSSCSSWLSGNANHTQASGQRSSAVSIQRGTVIVLGQVAVRLDRFSCGKDLLIRIMA